MATRKKKNDVAVKPKIEDTPNLEKLDLFITIVNQGQSGPVLKTLERVGSSAQFIQLGHGTAQKAIRDILGIEDNSKEIVFSILRHSAVPDAKAELEAFFAASKRNRGIGMAIPFSSLIGARLYRFLANVNN